DFRVATLVQKWQLAEQYELPRMKKPLTLATIVDQPSNAIGWSKTHAILFAPLAGEDQALAAGLAARNSHPVYAHVDPWWIYQTGAMGPLHPKDVENYPEAEAKLDEMINTIHERRVDGSAFFGFIDYDAGPVFSGRAERGNLISERRFRATYGLRNSFWDIYARSGERIPRSVATGSVRKFLDNYIVHWEGPRKVRGLFVEGPRTSHPWYMAGDMPIYWQGETMLHILDSSNLNNALYDYYLTGYRRAGEIMQHFGEGIKRIWAPEAVTGYKRSSQTLQILLQAYSFNWDHDLRAMAEATVGLVYDPEADLGVFWGVTDKPWQSARDLIEAWQLLGSPQTYDMAMRVAHYEWARRVGGGIPGGPANPFGIIASFLYRETGDPLVSKATDIWLRQFPDVRTAVSAIYSAFLTQGFPRAQDVLAQASTADLERVGWAAWDDGDGDQPVRVVLKKGQHETLDVQARTLAPGPIQSDPWIRAPALWPGSGSPRRHPRKPMRSDRRIRDGNW
ncbi:MAG: hypothetical protein LC725_05410, partial [Lentisphaerae bacterium]|nr:hypothetical protein [Lentisphaerota bacterium]